MFLCLRETGDPGGTNPGGKNRCNFVFDILVKVLAKNKAHKINAPFSVDRFVSGRLVDEHGAAAVAH